MSNISKILVVEDNPLLLLDLCDHLTELGYAPIPATNAGAGAHMLDETVDALITDIELGAGPDGLALARIAACAFPHLPIIVVSGGVRPTSADLPAGALFFPKPYRVETLLGALQHSSHAHAA
jgi:DNA-binding response OmpR family regulator